MKNRAIKALQDLLLVLLIVLTTVINPWLGLITGITWYAVTVIGTPKKKKKQQETNNQTYVANQWVYVEGNRKRVN